MERNQAGFEEKGAVESGDVAEADEDLWMGADGFVIKQWKQAWRTVAAAETEDSLRFRIREHLHDVAGALAVCSSKEAESLADIGREFGFETELLEDGYRVINCFGLGRRAGGSNDGDRIAGVQPRWFYKHAGDSRRCEKVCQGKDEIRNSKFETRNKFEIPDFNAF
jgi:hypothetical protein